MRYLKPYTLFERVSKETKLFESVNPEYDADWKKPGNPTREMLEVDLREILLEVIDLGYRPQLSGFTKGFSENGPYVWISNQKRLSHDDFWNDIIDTVERVKEYLTSKSFTTSEEIINKGTRNEQVYIYFDKDMVLSESVQDTKKEIEDVVSNSLNETFYISNRGDRSSKELSEELEWIEDSTLDLVDSGCTIKLRTYYVALGLKDCLGLTITIETYKLGLMLPIEVSDNLLTIDSYLRERGFVGYNWNEYDNPNSPTRFQTKIEASLNDVEGEFSKELSEFVEMLSRFTVKAPLDTLRVSYFKPE